MGSPRDEPQDKVSALDSSADTTVRDRLRRSTLIPDIAHLELLVVVGPNVQQVHKQDTERYILTNLNIASELLRDMTLGANMRVHLVRMIILSEPEPEIQMSTNITSSLRSVCDWGRRINPSNDSDPLHADLLLYITRYDLELPDGNKQVRGVTQLGGVCSSDWSCVITEDTGFDLGITIAHEVGHSFGIDHDGSANGCSRSGFMMASDGGYNSVDLTWSPCSRKQLLTFFSEGRAECVKDFPALRGSLQDWKPGLYYGVDDQCRIAFGSTARACSFSNPDLPPCRALSCHVKPEDIGSCKRLLVPLLDGTECAPNQWCLKGRCVSPDDFGISVVVNGSWSSWSGFSSCSRTCGGGVVLRTRECNNPRPAFGGNDCDGPDIEAELCNQLPCERTQLDFMAEQCSQTDPQPLYLLPNTASFYKWIPAVGFVKGDEQCRYMCQSDGESFIVSRGSHFADGTRCKSDVSTPYGATAACLRGRCQVFGCDGVLHSGKAWDVCGVCGGDESTCILTSDSYSGGGAKGKDYNTFLTLPVNATQVHIVNRAPVFTHLDDDHVEYRLHLTPDLLPEMEEVVLPGPLKQEITIQPEKQGRGSASGTLIPVEVYRKYGKEYGEKTNPNISFQFYVPRNKSLTDSSPRGKWAPLATPCSVTCGLGIQRNEHVCVDEDTNELLKPHYCKAPPPPTAQHTTCQLPSCPPRWDAGNFGVCSASCGGGFWVRHVRCVQKREHIVVKVPDSQCSADTAPHPVEKCNLHHCPARWSVSEPGNCSAVCGPGEAERSVSCVRQEGGLDVEVDHSFCLNQFRPPDWVPCVVNVCPIGWDSKGEEQPSLKSGLLPRSRQAPVYVWSPVVSQCSRSCGNGKVWFSCVDHQTRLGVPDFHCDSSSKPEPHTEMCGFSPCPPMWKVFRTSPCSVSCDLGVAQRNVSCVQFVHGKESVVPEDGCRAAVKPATTVPCLVQACTFKWEVKPWSQVHVTGWD
uniref:ADAM metallopeptidase with thrombospondin type 1 motif, 13 n=1 Tax=Poecilia formosa TaxID=48698 RepID=A0A096LWX1_POEFO